MSDAQTPAERRDEKAKAAHDNQVKAEKDFENHLSPDSDAAKGETAAPVTHGKAGTSFAKEDREVPAAEVENYQPGTAGDQADPDKVYESSKPHNPNAVSEEDAKAAEKAAADSKVELNGQGENKAAKADEAKVASGDKPANPDKGDLPPQSGSNKQPVNGSDAGKPKN